MENLKTDKLYKFLFWVFIIVSIVHVVYAGYSMRGLYCDGAFYLIKQLDYLSNGIFEFAYDGGHPRFIILAILQLPVMIAYSLFFIKSKFALMMIFSFFQFAFPVLALLWNFKLTERTKRIDVLFWSVFFYGAVICTYMIFSVVETIIGAVLHFILWNYLVSDIDYKKRDIVFILILIGIMFSTYEYVAYFGLIFFFAHFHYVLKDKSVKNQTVKSIIGFGSLAAAVYNVWFMFRTPGEGSEIMRFLKEATDYLPYILNMNSLFSILTVALLILFAFRKSKITFVAISFIFVLFVGAFIKLFMNQQSSIYPMWEQHMRTIPCLFLPLLFVGMHVKDIFSKSMNEAKYYNFICIALVCCIFQTTWQMMHSYYWIQNIEYMKKELASTNDLLYVPSEHEEISDFHNPELRRYIWHGIFAGTSLLYSDTYELKTLLLNYDERQDDGNGNFREWLYVIPDRENRMMMPFGAEISIKNEFWDMTKCAEALDKYNKEHNIQTLQ